MKTSKAQKRTGSSLKKKIAMATLDYKNDFLNQDLQDIERAAEYLTAAIEEGSDVFLLAVRDVVEAQGGIRPLAKSTKLNRENLYKMLTKEGNPRLSSITTVLDQLGFQVSFSAKLQETKVA